MIRTIEALNYRCLRHVRQALGPFHVLVGPNASGKTTFLDVVAFLGDLVTGDIEQAVGNRTQNFQDLVWRREGPKFELAIELAIPDGQKEKLNEKPFDRIRYEVAIGQESDEAELGILAEKVLLKTHREEPLAQPELFPIEPPPPPPRSILTPKGKGVKFVINKVPGGNDNFYDETDKGWDHAFKLGPRRSALGSLPEDESKFPVSTWLKGILSTGVQRLMLNSALMRKPSPPGKSQRFLPDGSNLPWVVKTLKKNHADRFQDWLEHIQISLNDIADIKTVDRPEDRHCYLVIKYKDGLNVPSWTVSDGTLRLLALTLPAYLPNLEGVYLIEEPENGIHPRAVETAFQSLSSVYDAQILLATHSPIVLSVCEPQQVLCFSKTKSGATDIVRGSEHPALRDWKRETTLGTLFASGVLG